MIHLLQDLDLIVENLSKSAEADFDRIILGDDLDGIEILCVNISG